MFIITASAIRQSLALRDRKKTKLYDLLFLNFVELRLVHNFLPFLNPVN